MAIRLSRRQDFLKPSPTLAIAARAKELKAQGHPVLSLAVGEPDWDTFETIKQKAIDGINQGQTKYTPSAGLPELRKTIAQKCTKDYGVDYKPSQVTVSTGAKFILFAALQALCDERDEVLIFAPYWVSYPTMVELCGAKPVVVPSEESHQFKPTIESLDKHTTPKTRLLIFNSPSNPSGVVWHKDELKKLADWLRKHPDIVVLSDDIYDHLVFDGSKRAAHLLDVAPDLKDRIILINSASKTFSMTGWRVGWAVGDEKVINLMTQYQSQTVSCTAGFAQTATAFALDHTEKELSEAVVKLKTRRDKMVQFLKEVPGLKCPPAEGAFYLWADVRSWIGKKLDGQTLDSTRDIATVLLEKFYVATVPGIESGTEGFLRLSFCLSEKDLSESATRLQKFSQSLG